MTAYRRILVAVDLSPESAYVVARARALGGRAAELSIVHVMEPFPIGYMTSASYEAVYSATLQHYRNAMLELGGATGISAQRLHNVVGNPAHEIRRVAKDIDADLIVVGGHGKHGFESLLHSTSHHVVHGAECDLLIAHIPQPAST